MSSGRPVAGTPGSEATPSSAADAREGILDASPDAGPGLVLVVAFDRNRAIGRHNALPWHLPDDLRRFKALTLGKPLLMGRKTAESLGRALPGRLNLVLTRGSNVPFDGMHAVASLDDALQIALAEGAGELCVIGGAQIYALALPRAVKLHATHVETVVEGADAFFPPYDVACWQPLAREHHAADARHACAFEFVDYVRVDAEDADAVPVGA